jgi:hypothetical protein
MHAATFATHIKNEERKTVGKERKKNQEVKAKDGWKKKDSPLNVRTRTYSKFKTLKTIDLFRYF